MLYIPNVHFHRWKQTVQPEAMVSSFSYLQAVLAGVFVLICSFLFSDYYLLFISYSFQRRSTLYLCSVFLIVDDTLWRDKLFDLHESASFRQTYEPNAQTILCLIIH